MKNSIASIQLLYKPWLVGVYAGHTTCWYSEVYADIPLRLYPPQQVLYLSYQLPIHALYSSYGTLLTLLNFMMYSDACATSSDMYTRIFFTDTFFVSI